MTAPLAFQTAHDALLPSTANLWSPCGTVEPCRTLPQPRGTRRSGGTIAVDPCGTLCNPVKPYLPRAQTLLKETCGALRVPSGFHQGSTRLWEGSTRVQPGFHQRGFAHGRNTKQNSKVKGWAHFHHEVLQGLRGGGQS